MPEVTVAALVYRDAGWIRWMKEGIIAAKNDYAAYRLMVISNDGTPEVEGSKHVTHVFRNPDPAEHFIKRVYRAWNYAVASAKTELVCLINSDMYVSDYWLDELVLCREKMGKCMPTSLLVESGRLASAMPEYVKDFGTSPETFQTEAFLTHAEKIRQPGMIEPGRLFMPLLVAKSEFIGYPEGNPFVNGKTISGDKALFDEMSRRGYPWVTCMGSIVYHTQEGEMRS